MIESFQILWHRFVIEADPHMMSRLTYLTQCAAHHMPARASGHYEVRAVVNGWQILEDGDPLETARDAAGVLEVVYRRTHQRAYELASLTGWVRLHACVADFPIGRVLFVGPSGIGKSTLACRLLHAGIAVPADESVVVRQGQSVPVARRFHLKRDAELVLTHIEQAIRSAPMLDDGSVRAIDPSVLGMSWMITELTVQHVVLLRQRSLGIDLRRISSVEALPDLLGQTFMNQETKATVVREISLVLGVAECWELSADAESVQQLHRFAEVKGAHSG